MVRLHTVAALVLVLSACEQVRWKPPAEKPVVKTAVAEAPPLAPGELMAGPYLVLGERGQGVVRFEVHGEGCAQGNVTIEGQTIEAQPIGNLAKDERLQGTVCEAPLPALPRTTPFEYTLKPFEAASRTARLPPLPGDTNAAPPFTILVLADTRTGHDIHGEVVARSMLEAASLIVNLGDIVEMNQRLKEWYQFFEIEEELLSTAPLVVVPGNHETWMDPEFGALMLNRFFGRAGVGGTGHHAIDVGRLHLLFLDVYWGEDLLGEGLQWLRSDLESVPANRLVLVFLHEPPISFGAHRPRPAIKRLMPLFKELGVAAVIAGHAHVYEHFVVDGLHYVTAGGGGAGLHEANLNVFEGQQQYLQKSSSEHHYLLLTVGEKSVEFTVKRLSGDPVESWAVDLPTP